ncbi:MAG TPA: Maf family protein [Oceanipulchritudo sp.]|nr:Maf family protein [Oceanipulchritudo sp.]
MNNSCPWILASASPRRRELLARLNPDFLVVSPDVEEWEPDEADPVHQVEENALRKGLAVAAQHPDALVIAADTTVALGQRLFAKPGNREEAVAMLKALSGRRHQVLTGMALLRNGQTHCFHETSEVEFMELDDARIDAYLERVHVLDKAGAYAIQEEADLIIHEFSGSFENIMGLPVQRLREELVQLQWVDPATLQE